LVSGSRESAPQQRNGEVWRTADRLKKLNRWGMVLQIRHMWPI